MATVIDALVVSLGLDASGFIKGQKQAAESMKKTRDEAGQFGKEVEASGKKVDEAFSSMLSGALKLFAAFATAKGIKDLIGQLSEANSALARLAANLNMSPTALSTWGLAIERTGGNAADAGRSFQTLSDAFNQLRTTGQSALLPWLAKISAMGGAAFDWSKPVTQQMLTLSQNLSEIAKKDRGLAVFLGRQLGIDQGTINLLLQGPEAVKKALADAEKYAVTQKQSEAALRIEQAWIRVKQALDAVGNRILEFVEPAFTKLLETARQFIDANLLGKFSETWENIYKIISKFIGLIGALFTDNTDGIKKRWAELIETIKNSGPQILDAIKDAFKAALEWIEGRFAALGGLVPSWIKKGFAEIFGVKSAEAHAYEGEPGQGGAAGAGRGPTGAGRVHMGSHAARGALAANQKEAYAAARSEGLSDQAARALVANLSGESLANPKDYHWDVSHYSQGVGQWDPQRSEAIRRQFGKLPKDMSVAEQTKAAIWEIRNNPRFRQTREALERGENVDEMIGALVRNYEVPADKAGAIAQRRGFYNGLPKSLDTQTAKDGNAPKAPPVPAFIRSGYGAPGAASISTDNSQRSYSNSTETNVGNITIHTASTDAGGIANDIGGAINRFNLASQANYGPA